MRAGVSEGKWGREKSIGAWGRGRGALEGVVRGGGGRYGKTKDFIRIPTLLLSLSL